MQNSKKLYKSRDKMICGVCGGFADFFGCDPTLVRLGFAFFTLFAFTGLIAYFIAAFIIPDAPYDK